jgi:7,8-dihydropterin-6-yl-methyl-4-(beta-D-ribofuranosyl)aminobenzene 5'-phosphate synthase
MCTDHGWHGAHATGAARPAERREPLDIPLQPVDSLTITTLVDNLYDALMPDQGPARRTGPGSGATGERLPAATMAGGFVPDGLVAEHGYSLLLTLTIGARTHRLLFDCGVSPDGMVENMRRLDVDPRDVEAVVLSHGHFDHTAGLDGLMRRLGRSNLPLLLHPDFWNRRRVQVPGRDPREIPTTSRSALQGGGFTIVEDRQPSFLFQDALLVTGEVDRTTGYEPGFPPQEMWTGERWEPDPLVLDDQAVVVSVRDRGLVVITGCGHAGVVNTTRYARKLTGVQQVCGVIGGFHLSGPAFEPIIDRTCADLAALDPQIVVPGHCTGWRGQHALTRTFGDHLVPSCVGTRFEL